MTQDVVLWKRRQTENNTNLEYLETKIYTKYITDINYKEYLIFQILNNNIDNICILFDDYQTKIKK